MTGVQTCALPIFAYFNANQRHLEVPTVSLTSRLWQSKVASTKMDAIADCQPVSPHPNCQQIFSLSSVPMSNVPPPWFTGAPLFTLVPVKNLQKFSNGWSIRVKE